MKARQAEATELPTTAELERELAKLKRRVKRERQARLEAERIAEETTRQMYDVNQRLKSSNQELEQFAYASSHDLREPLRMISTYVGFLAKKYGESEDEKVQKYLKYIVDGTEQMGALIDSLLLFSRVERMGADFVPASLEAPLRNAMKPLRLIIEETGAVVEWTDLLIVDIDVDQLTQLFQNLLGNAIKFRKTDQAPRIDITVERNGPMWTIRVRDDGVGFEQAYAERVFGIFKRLHTRQEFEGTGLGLALCKKIVERHGGTIRAESEPDVGTTIVFTLPTVRARTPPSTDDAATGGDATMDEDEGPDRATSSVSETGKTPEGRQ